MLNITTKLRDHQTKALEKAIPVLKDRGYFWFLMGCSVGKSLTSLAAASALNVSSILVITKIAAFYTAWYSDITRHTNGLPVIILDKGSAKDKYNVLMTAPKESIIVVNYETAKLLKGAIKLRNFDLIIADECHKLKTHNSQVSLDLADACSTAAYRIGLTATGFDDRPTDAYGQVRWFDPVLMKGRTHHKSRVLGGWNEFFDHHVNYYQPSPGVKIPVKSNPYKNLDELHAKIDPFTFYIKTEDAIDLPPEQHISRVVAMPSEYKRIYRELRNDLLARINDDVMLAENVLTEQLRLAQVTGGFYVTDTGETKYLEQKSPKLAAVIDILDEIGKEPVVIFSAFKHDIALLEKSIRDVYSERAIFHLTGTRHDEFHWQTERQDDSILLANVGAGSEGVDLSRARYGIIYSLGYSRSQYTQMLWRIRRSGSDKTKPVIWFHVSMEGSVDDIITTALEKKKEVAEELYERLGIK